MKLRLEDGCEATTNEFEQKATGAILPLEFDIQFQEYIYELHKLLMSIKSP